MLSTKHTKKFAIFQKLQQENKSKVNKQHKRLIIARNKTKK
jgi:hypothetical protein